MLIVTNSFSNIMAVPFSMERLVYTKASLATAAMPQGGIIEHAIGHPNFILQASILCSDSYRWETAIKISSPCSS